MKTSEIKLSVKLNEDKMPESITWHASDAGMAADKPCKALIISLFDEKEKATMRIDLWTKDMLVDEMKRFFFDTFMSMGSTLKTATGDEELSEEIKKFAEWFGQKSGVISAKA